MSTYIQLTADCDTPAEATLAFEAATKLPGCLGGRVFEPSSARQGWRVLTYHVDNLPPGAKSVTNAVARVRVPDSLREACGLLEAPWLGLKWQQ